MPRLDPLRPPPAAYYAANLSAVLGHVADRYQSIVPANLAKLLKAYAGLGEPGRRLYARLVVRKGPAFRLDKINYPEVPDLPLAITQLVSAGLAGVNQPVRADVLVGLLPVPELRRWLPLPRTADRQPNKLPRAAYVEQLLGCCSDQQLRQRVQQHIAWLHLRQQPALQDALLLYFGNRQQDLSTFVTQDLGLFRYEAYSLVGAAAPLQAAQQVTNTLGLQRLADLTHRLGGFELGDLRGRELALWLVEQLSEPQELRRLNTRRLRALVGVGHWLERSGCLEEALLAFAEANRAPARERSVRLLARLQRLDSAAQLLEQIKQSPGSAAEAEFGQTFVLPAPGQTGGGRCVRPKHQYPTTTVSLAQVGAVATPGIEAQALARLTANGGLGWHVENSLPKGLVGLAYWSAIFSPQAGMFTHPFQNGPADLYWDDFASARQQTIDQLECTWQVEGEFAARLLNTTQQKQGIQNALVHWGLFTVDFAQALLRYIPAGHLQRIAQFMVGNLGAFRQGFPDLLVIYGPQNYEFVEVKGPRDALQPAQRSWLAQLQAMGLPVRVLKFCP